MLLITFNLTAVVCQPYKLVAVISPTGTWIAGHKCLAGLGLDHPLPDRELRYLLACDWQQQSRNIFLWQQDIGDCATLPKGSNLPDVRSEELVLDARYGLQHRSPGSGAQSTRGAEARLPLAECRSFSPASSFAVLASEVAREVGVEPRALAVRALLHLPRVALYKGWVTRWQAQKELRISAERLRRDAWAARTHLPAEKFSLHELAFELIEPSRAVPILTSLHYLQSVRPHSVYFALVDPIKRLPVSLCSVSPLEWKCVRGQIWTQFAIRPEQAWDVARVYSADTAPANAISSLLSRVRTYFRRNMPSAELLVTAVDPNLGFTGCSYRAANWQHWMTVKARPYLYENSRYVTPRQLRERYGTSSLVDLRAKYPGRFQSSRVRLLDSMIYCCSVNGETMVVPAQERRRLHR